MTKAAPPSRTPPCHPRVPLRHPREGGDPSGNKRNISIVFINHTDFPALQILKPGFRHCFALIHSGKKIFVIDPLMNNLCLFELTPKQFEKLQAELKAQNATVVQAQAHKFPKRFAIGLYSCVAVIKRLLGISSPFILTPYQLYKHLTTKTKE